MDSKIDRYLGGKIEKSYFIYFLFTSQILSGGLNLLVLHLAKKKPQATSTYYTCKLYIRLVKILEISFSIYLIFAS